MTEAQEQEINKLLRKGYHRTTNGLSHDGSLGIGTIIELQKGNELVYIWNNGKVIKDETPLQKQSKNQDKEE